MIQEPIPNNISIQQYNHNDILEPWCSNKWYIVKDSTKNKSIQYMRNDGRWFNYMQDNPSNLHGGTYYNSIHDAEVAYYATQNKNDQNYTKEITNQTHPASFKKNERETKSNDITEG